jgi:hypothetical protein
VHVPDGDEDEVCEEDDVDGTVDQEIDARQLRRGMAGVALAEDKIEQMIRSPPS